MIGKMLCRFGWHRWDYRITFVFESYDECGRCGTTKAVTR